MKTVEVAVGGLDHDAVFSEVWSEAGRGSGLQDDAGRRAVVDPDPRGAIPVELEEVMVTAAVSGDEELAVAEETAGASTLNPKGLPSSAHSHLFAPPLYHLWRRVPSWQVTKTFKVGMGAPTLIAWVPGGRPWPYQSQVLFLVFHHISQRSPRD